MASVTQRIEEIKQPRGGYLNIKKFETIDLDDGMKLSETENVNPGLVGLVVDYLTRYLVGSRLEDAFQFSLRGALCLDKVNKDSCSFNYALELLNGIKGTDDASIMNASKLVGFDVCFRVGAYYYRPVEQINPNNETIRNIKIMIDRSISFWDDYGPVIKEGFSFPSGYTDLVTAGDCDYLTKNTLWDFKVSKREPLSKHTLQLLMYYIMGCHSTHSEFKSIESLGLFNPRLNKIYIKDIASISSKTLDDVARDVIGFK